MNPYAAKQHKSVGIHPIYKIRVPKKIEAKRREQACNKINRGRVETQPRFKIQYPMKNHDKDADLYPKRCTITEKYFYFIVVLRHVVNTKKTLHQQVRFN